MDNLTHGLLGLAVGSLYRPDSRGPVGDDGTTGRAVVWGAVLAAELPDLDVFYGTSDPLSEFKYHRGLTHSFIFAPVVAAVATAIVKIFFRRARVGPVYAFSLLAVLLAHITADLWTGWGTMSLQPFSPVRLGLDWVNIIDPVMLGILLAGVVYALRRPQARRRALTMALALTLAYVGVRGTVHTLFEHQVAGRYQGAAKMAVWPDMNPIGEWEYVAQVGDQYATGRVGFRRGVVEQARVAVPDAQDPAVAAALASSDLAPLFRFTAFPVVTDERIAGGGTRLAVSDLKYGYFRFGVVLDAAGHVALISQPRHSFTNPPARSGG
ncbi:MAG: metal-dependent hydrolase [Symbiobacteriia bacterium]